MGRENTMDHCLENCRIALTAWNSQVFGHVRKSIEHMQGKLQSLEAQATGLSKQEQIRDTRMELNKLYAVEEDMWHQRSRSNWAKSGDKNTRYFHEKTSSRKRKSTIMGLMDESNQWQEDPEVVKGIAVGYYQNLFSSNHGDVQGELLEAIEARVSEPMNALLIRDFQVAEMRKALKQMHPLKAPGPDEGLSSLIKKAALEERIHGISICRRGPQLSHLFFADDSLLFCQATPGECEELLHFLQVYELSTGQQLNREKTTLFFSRNTPPDTQECIKQMFGAEIIKQREKYLGLPSLVGRSRRNTFQQLKERLANKLSGWKEKLLSNVGKEVLIKAVAQAIPAHTMSCFLLPISLCDEMMSIVQNF